MAGVSPDRVTSPSIDRVSLSPAWGKQRKRLAVSANRELILQL
jgi:hypothetical protein